MIYLNRGMFKPSIVLVSIALLPMFIACVVSCFLNYGIEKLIISIVLLLLYFTIIFVIYKYSKKDYYFMEVNEKTISIKYPNLICNLNPTIISINDIVSIEYYRLWSLKAWCMLYK